MFSVMMMTATSLAHAQILMEKSRVKLTVQPGETVVDHINLHNTGDISKSIRIYWEDFEYVEPFNGKKIFLPAGTSSYSLSDWITYAPIEVTIPPKSKKKIDFTINVPIDAVGGHYGVLFFEDIPTGGKMTNVGVSIITRLGALFYIDSTNKDKSASVHHIEVKGNELVGQFSNRGNVFMIPRGVYYVMNNDGLVASRGEVGDIYLPPSEETSFSVSFSDVEQPGDYMIVMTFDLDEGDSVVFEVDFSLNADRSLTIHHIRN